MEIKQYATKQPMGQRNQIRNQKIHRDKSLQCSKSSSKRKAHSNISLHQDTRKASNNLTLHLKEFKQEEQMELKVSWRKGIIKIREEINEVETKKEI